MKPDTFTLSSGSSASSPSTQPQEETQFMITLPLTRIEAQVLRDHLQHQAEFYRKHIDVFRDLMRTGNDPERKAIYRQMHQKEADLLRHLDAILEKF